MAEHENPGAGKQTTISAFGIINWDLMCAVGWSWILWEEGRDEKKVTQENVLSGQTGDICPNDEYIWVYCLHLLLKRKNTHLLMVIRQEVRDELTVLGTSVEIHLFVILSAHYKVDL